jgi:hypothetical protein
VVVDEGLVSFLVSAVVSVFVSLFDSVFVSALAEPSFSLAADESFYA